jgi:hypothetical protein
VIVEKQICKMERVTECVPEVIKVNVCKTELRTEQVPVTITKCIPECRTETYTVMVRKCVPYQATRTVNVCVPCQETVTLTRMVCRKVEKDVPVCATECSRPACGLGLGGLLRHPLFCR